MTEPSEPPTEPVFLTHTRAGYDAIAADYERLVAGELESEPLGRAMLAAYAEIVRDPGGPVVEVGSGQGRITAYLDGLGVPISGIELSPAMLARARANFPGLRFEPGTMTALDLKDGELGGLVSWYSLIHIPPERHPGVLAEFHRVLAPGGHLLLAFQVGDAPLHFDEAFGHAVDLDFHRLDPDRVTATLTAAGFTIRARLIRAAETVERSEKVPQACLIAGKPAA